MSSDVVCMALGRVPAGEQRCRFLAVGLADNTVRIVSLDPAVSIQSQVRSPDKYWKTIFFISHPKYMLWVLKRTVLMSSSFEHPKHIFKLMGKKIIKILRS